MNEVKISSFQEFILENEAPKDLVGFALSVGVINMTTGNTSHDWSIFEEIGKTKHYVYFTGRNLIIAAEGTFNPGERVILVGNDNNRMIGSWTIKWGCVADKETLLKKLKDEGFDYYPVRAFTSKKGNKKLDTSFSIKGTEYLEDYNKRTKKKLKF